MFRVWSSPHRRSAFTLIELLVVIVIISILAGLALPVFNQVLIKSRQTTTLSNMRQVGIGFSLYAGDNSNQLAGRTAGAPLDGTGQAGWPKALQPYVQNLKVYNSPIPGYQGTTYQVTDPVLLVDNAKNYTDYIANGFSDKTAYTDATILPRFNGISEPSKVILLGIPKPGAYAFYLDYYNGNESTILSRTPWPTGSAYVFCDGSSRFLMYRTTDNMTVAPTSAGEYSDWLWRVDKLNAAAGP